MTRSSPIFLKAPHYVLGEIEEEHTAISNLPARIAELRILPRADSWGWGTIRRTLNGCANLLAGIRTADEMVASGRHRRVLVITTDRIGDEAARMEKFALFSDGAASCAVTDERGLPGFELVSSATAHNIAELDWSNELNSDLSRQVNESLLTPFGMQAGDVSGLMHANIFRPIV